MDLKSRQLRQLSTGHSVELNPQWSGDDREIYFVSDRQGLLNVFRTPVDTFSPEQITNVDTGVGSITPTGPTLSMSDDGSSLALTVFQRGRPRLVVISTENLTALASPAAVTPAPALAARNSRRLISAI